ncbi:adenosine deaminase [Micromonospora fluostatini]|uniref:adenosine deaminase n=1 Tax=Micromonospora sp. JCM 30529 TaxID=3421643 RepID=UPI003D18115C
MTDAPPVPGDVRDLAALPKGHLHLHLEGAMRPETLAELAQRHGRAVPPTRGYGSFLAFVDLYVAACAVLRTTEDLQRLTREVVQDAARDGAVWVEPSIYPVHHVGTIGPVEEVTAAVVTAGQEAAREYGIGFGLMLAANRTADPAEAERIARVAAGWAGRGVVSFGLADNEDGYPPEPFVEAFRIAREAGLLAAPHAGELAGPESVAAALTLLGADRVQHGVRAVEDPELLRRLADAGTCLDVCPTSNLLLSVVPSLAEHPLPRLLAAGVRCSVNADDPLLFGPGLLAEYELCRDELGLDDRALAAVARSSVESSGADPATKRSAVAGIDAWERQPATPTAGPTGAAAGPVPAGDRRSQP